MPDYSNLEDMLYRGFLTSEMTVGPVPIVFKTLNQIEHNLVELQSYSPNEGWEQEASYSLAYATLFFNNVNVLPDRHEAIPLLAEHYLSLPNRVLITLLTTVNALNTRASECIEQVEAYCYGPRSRQMWIMHQGSQLCDPQFTGYAGTDQLGLNMHQRLWSYFNVVEDREEEYQREYSLAKFIVSPHASKDIKRIDQKDRKRERQKQKRRRAKHEGRDPSMIEENNQIRITNETAEELLDQMEASVRGDKDYHDLVIEQHRKKVHEAYQQKRREIKERKERIRQERLERYREEIAADLDFEGYTPEEIEHYLQMSDENRYERRQEAAGSPSLEEKERNLLRWGFIDEEDIPVERRHLYREDDEDDEDFDNPLIKEHYERVTNDLSKMRAPKWDDEE